MLHIAKKDLNSTLKSLSSDLLLWLHDDLKENTNKEDITYIIKDIVSSELSCDIDSVIVNNVLINTLSSAIILEIARRYGAVDDFNHLQLCSLKVSQPPKNSLYNEIIENTGLILSL